MLAYFDNAGEKVIFAMLIVGLIFIGVIALGELVESMHRRRSGH